MKRKLPIVRIIAGMIACALIITGINLFMMANRVENRFEEQSVARPLDMKVDLSQRGTFSAPLTQTWSACHGQTIDLHLGGSGNTKPVLSELLASLKLSWVITHSDGTVLVEETSWTYSPEQNTRDDGIVSIGYFHPFEPGEYVFSCTVLAPGPALQEIDQRLVCQYLPCGLELMPATLGKLLGGVVFAISGVLLFCIASYRK